MTRKPPGMVETRRVERFDIHPDPDGHPSAAQRPVEAVNTAAVPVPAATERIDSPMRRDDLRALGPMDFKGTPSPEDYRLAYGGGCSG